MISLDAPTADDLNWVVTRHAEIYQDEYAWHGTFQSLVASVVADFAERADPVRERCWIAKLEGERAGSVFLMSTDDPRVGQLRLLLVEPTARGRGIGQLLVESCINEAQRLGYRQLKLWTNSVLHAARHIYERAGFELVASEAHEDFGPPEVSQTWQREL